MAKTTKELLELMKNSSDYMDYAAALRGDITKTRMRLDCALSVLLRELQLKKSEVIARSGIENHYAYQIFSGLKTPNRDKVIMLCFGLGLSPEESIDLMKITGYPPLYAKEERDNAILYCLTKSYSIVKTNTLLDELGLEILV